MKMKPKDFQDWIVWQKEHPFGEVIKLPEAYTASILNSGS